MYAGCNVMAMILSTGIKNSGILKIPYWKWAGEFQQMLACEQGVHVYADNIKCRPRLFFGTSYYTIIFKIGQVPGSLSLK